MQCGRLEECVPPCVSVRTVVSADLGEAAEELWRKLHCKHTHLVTGLS